MGRAKYIWVTLVPLVFLGTNTLYGGYLNITNNYYPLAIGANAARQRAKGGCSPSARSS